MEEEDGQKRRAFLAFPLSKLTANGHQRPASLEESEGQDSSDEPSAPMRFFNRLGRKISPVVDAHRSDPAARDYAPRQAEVAAATSATAAVNVSDSD